MLEMAACKLLARTLSHKIYHTRSYSVIERQNLRSTNSISKAQKCTKSSIFRELYPWKTKEEFVDALAANVIYNQEGIIALNKPYGVPVRKESQVFGENESLFSIEEALKDLAVALGHDKLMPVKITERFTSGISLFSSNELVSSKIRKCFASNKTLQIPTYKFLAITFGELQQINCSDTVRLGWLTDSDYSGKVPYIMKNYSKKSVKEGLVQEFRLLYRILSQNKSDPICNLVEIETSSNKNHLVRLYMSHCLSSILGDHLYGNRVQDILGTRLAIGPILGDNLSTFQKIPAGILTRMQVEDSSIVPHYLHLSQVTLSRYNKKKPLVLRATAPPHFQSTCQFLDLTFDDK